MTPVSLSEILLNVGEENNMKIKSKMKHFI